jgi:hypothetical protein
LNESEKKRGKPKLNEIRKGLIEVYIAPLIHQYKVKGI